MNKKKVTAGMLSVSLIAPMVAQMIPITVSATDVANVSTVRYSGRRDICTGNEMVQGLALKFQDTGGNGYISDNFVIWKINDKITEEEATNYDYSKAEKICTINTISFNEDSKTKWVDANGNVAKYDTDGFFDGQYSVTGKPTYIELTAGEYVVEYIGSKTLINHKGGKIPFTVMEGQETGVDYEGVYSPQLPELPDIPEKPAIEQGSLEIQAIVVETDENGNPIKDGDNFVATGEKVPNVKIVVNDDKYYTQADIDEAMGNINDSLGGLGGSLGDLGGILGGMLGGSGSLTVDESTVVAEFEAEGLLDGRPFENLITDENGSAIIDNINVNTYPLSIEIPEGWAMADIENDENFDMEVVKDTRAIHVIELYKIPEKDDDNPNKPIEVPQALKVIVVKKGTDEEIPGAKFIVRAQNKPDFDFSETSVVGGVTKTSVLADTYVASLVSVPEGYKLNTDTDTVTLVPVTEEGIVTTLKLEIEEGDPIGALNVIVRDKDTKEPIPDAKVEIYVEDALLTTIRTDELGSVAEGDLPAGDYTIKVTEVPDGYNEPENQTATVVVNQTTTAIFEIEKGKGNLDVVVRDKDTKEPIPDAKVVIKDEDGNIIKTVITKEDGTIDKTELPEGKYTVSVIEVPDGYTPPEDQEVVIEKDTDKSLIFEVEKGKGNLDVIVRDKDTKEPIPNATVEIRDEKGNIVTIVKTDSNGRVSEKDLPSGEYTIKVTEVPEGYTVPNDQTTIVKDKETTQVIFELEKGQGALSVLIRDKDTKEPIPNAKVQILDKNNKVVYETVTNTDGKVDKDKLPAGDYTIKVIAVPDGYTPPADTVAPVKVGKRTNVILELEKGQGNLEVTIRDKDTKNPIPNCIVQVTDKNGALIITLTTNSNGQIRKENLPVGDYVIRVQAVPEGYNIPEVEKATVKKNETAKVIIELEKSTGALEVIVRDKNTKEPIPNATVEVRDEKGNIILNTTTDSNGRINKDKLPVGKYTIKVTSAPDGYTLPNDQEITIKKSVKTTVIFELEKPVKVVNNVNNVQTGDNNNIFGFVSIGIASLAGMLFTFKRRKKD